MILNGRGGTRNIVDSQGNIDQLPAVALSVALFGGKALLFRILDLDIDPATGEVVDSEEACLDFVAAKTRALTLAKAGRLIAIIPCAANCSTEHKLANCPL